MKLFPLLFLAIFVTSSAPAPSPNAPESQATLKYIHDSWTLLTRSVSDCQSLSDVKVKGTPVLYLPAGMSAPSDVAAAEQKCHIRVLNLPKAIERIGDLQPEVLPAQGLLYLPHPYVVPGGRFNEMYGWDSYFIILGLEADHRAALAKGMVDNFLFEIENYGGILNANRTYYLTRSQPPFLTSMIRAVYQAPGSFPNTPEGRVQAQNWLAHAYTMAEKDYAYWMRPEHRASRTGLARFFGYGNGPVPELGTDSDYYVSVIRWIVEHPHAGGEQFLVKGAQNPDAAEAARLKLTSCDVRASTLCRRAWYGGYRLSRDFYEGDRAMRESGFDPSFRFGVFSGATEDYAPVGLNCLLYRYERDMEHFALLLEKPVDAMRWDMRARMRYVAMQRYLWREKEGVFADYDFVHERPSDYAFITSLYPLWAGIASRAQAASIEAKLGVFERPGGLAASSYDSGLQWDLPYGWAPTNWLAVVGLENYGDHKDAAQIAAHWNATVDHAFAADGTIREKYNVVTSSAQVHVTAGYKQDVIGFGWTNAVYLKMREVIRETEPGVGDE